MLYGLISIVIKHSISNRNKQFCETQYVIALLTYDIHTYIHVHYKYSLLEDRLFSYLFWQVYELNTSYIVHISSLTCLTYLEYLCTAPMLTLLKNTYHNKNV